METKDILNSIDQFANELIALPESIISGLNNATEDEDVKAVINAYAEPFTNQFKEVSNLLKNNYKSAALQAKKEATDLLKMSSGLELIKGAKGLTKNLKGLFPKLGLNSIIKEIKKLVLFILDKLKVPQLIIDIILIIDQILNALLGLDLPTSMPSMLSKMEVHYMDELASHARLKKERMYMFNEEESTK